LANKGVIKKKPTKLVAKIEYTNSTKFLKRTRDTNRPYKETIAMLTKTEDSKESLLANHSNR
jgi:hypothetical protein